MHGRTLCPQCATPLRIRDHTFVGRRVQCPECRTSLRIERSGDTELVARRIHDDPTVPGTVREKTLKKPAAAVLHTSFWRWLNSPLTAAWLVGIAVVTFLALLVLGPRTRRAASVSKTPQTQSPAQPASQSSTEPPTAVISPSQGHSPTTASESLPPAPQALPEQKTPPSVPDLPAISALTPDNSPKPLPWPRPPAVVKVNLPTKMALPYSLFKQANAVTRRELLQSLEEQLGAPIRYDQQELARGLKETLTFELQNTTIGGVIQYVADSADWELTVEDTGLRLRPKPPPATP